MGNSYLYFYINIIERGWPSKTQVPPGGHEEVGDNERGERGIVTDIPTSFENII